MSPRTLSEVLSTTSDPLVVEWRTRRERWHARQKAVAAEVVGKPVPAEIHVPGTFGQAVSEVGQ